MRRLTLQSTATPAHPLRPAFREKDNVYSGRIGSTGVWERGVRGVQRPSSGTPSVGQVVRGAGRG